MHAVAYAVAALALFASVARAEPAAYVVSVNGRTTAARAEHAPRQPASLAKLAAALALLRRLPPDSPAFRDGVVTVSARAARETGARLGLRAGDRAPLPQLFAAMLVASGNDACLALVEHASAGHAAQFVGDMNRLALGLGMRETRFVDPCGHDRAGQRTTAADLALLAQRAIAEDAIVAATQRKYAQVQLESGRLLLARNSNALLGQFNGVFGLKTGYTAQAGGCVIAASKLGHATVVVVILGSNDRWREAARLMNDAFDEALPLGRAIAPSARDTPQ